MGLILTADDIKPGMYTSVLSWKTPEGSGDRRRGHSRPPAAPSVPPGIPLRVLETSLPFVACSVLEPDGTENDITIVDVRLVTMCRLKKQFIRAIKTFAASNKSQQPDQEEGNKVTEHRDITAQR